MSRPFRHAPHASAGRMLWLLPMGLLLAYLLLWPTVIRPEVWSAPKDAGYTGVYAVNQKLADLQVRELGSGRVGPEFILAVGEHLYTGLLNGEVLRWEADGSAFTRVVDTGGRPLGLDVDAQGRLLVADALKGLLRVTGEGAGARIEPLLRTVDSPVAGDPVGYADAVKVGPDGTIWLTDASRRFRASPALSTFDASVLDVLEHSCSGRLIAQDARTLQARVAIQGMCFPNGLAFSGDGRTLFVSETETYRILAIDLARLSVVRTAEGDNGVPTLAQAMQQGAARVLIDNLPGFPDNLTRAPSGRIWVGLTKPRSPVIDFAAAHPILREVTLRLPHALWPVPKAYGHVLAFNDAGRVVDDLQDPTGAYPETTAATEAGGRLWIQSLNTGTVGSMVYPGPPTATALLH